MIGRAVVVVVMVGVTGLLTASAGSVEVLVARQPLAALPLQLGDWRGMEVALPGDVLHQLGVDDYLNRTYVHHGEAPIGLYVGYYDSQRQGDTIHSPQNCLPGAGWQSVESGYLTLQDGRGEVRVNQYVIQKGVDRQVVLYWYQGRGRVVANEYMNKGLLILDAARQHRTNGGLVRVITPIVHDTLDATTRASRFAAALLPYLEAYLP